jgi:hypothetical protein
MKKFGIRKVGIAPKEAKQDVNYVSNQPKYEF